MADKFFDEMSPRDMRKWLEKDRELLRIMMEERLEHMTHLTSVVKEYEAGTALREEVMEEVESYFKRWGVPIAEDRKTEDKIQRMAGYQANCDPWSWRDETSPADMRIGLEKEREMLRIMTKVRLREFTAFVKAYEAGKLTWKQVDRKLDAYLGRWDGRLARNREEDERIEELAWEKVNAPSDRKAVDKASKSRDRTWKQRLAKEENQAERKR